MSKNLIITGGSGSLGRYFVQNFLKKKFKVFNLSRKKPKKIFENEKFFQCDLSNIKDVSKCLKVIKKSNKIDFIISCAGNSKKNYKKNISSDDFIISFKDNFICFSNLLECYEEIFLNKSTKIIVISSIAGGKIIDAPINYSISKAALNHYCKIKAQYLSKHNININIISPGNIYMKNNNWGKNLKNNPLKFKKYIKKNVPLNLFCNPSQLFELCEFLLSKNGNNITGSNFILDGGQSL
jgi:3-oxoacyl-[acyl-carrier protein] reductase